jgi:hypothetical protein
VEICNKDRVIFHDAALSASLLERTRPILGVEMSGWLHEGSNARLFYHRYVPGQYS